MDYIYAIAFGLLIGIIICFKGFKRNKKENIIDKEHMIVEFILCACGNPSDYYVIASPSIPAIIRCNKCKAQVSGRTFEEANIKWEALQERKLIKKKWYQDNNQDDLMKGD